MGLLSPLLDGTGNAASVTPGRLAIGRDLFVPGVDLRAPGTEAFGAGTLVEPFVVEGSSITLDQLVVEVTTASTAGGLARLGIATATAGWGTAALALDAGTVTIDTIGKKTKTISLTLAPGRYYKMIRTVGATYRIWRGGNQWFGIDNAVGANSLVRAAAISGSDPAIAFTDPPATVFTRYSNATGVQHAILCRISNPGA